MIIHATVIYYVVNSLISSHKIHFKTRETYTKWSVGYDSIVGWPPLTLRPSKTERT